jgi:ubiquinone/menaquinone biosynthesis C-methylase UbiE
MKRNFDNFNIYLNELMQDDYGQQPDPGHTKMARQVIDEWIANMTSCHSVLDIGCGATAFAQSMFKKLEIEYQGITLSKDGLSAQELGKNVKIMDMSFLEFPDNSFDLIFARHVLEHSPMPLVTMMEWRRVARAWMCVVLPNPDHYGWAGRQHYSVMHPNQAEFLIDRAGWHIIWTDFSEPSELRYMAEKKRTSRYEEVGVPKDS